LAGRSTSFFPGRRNTIKKEREKERSREREKRERKRKREEKEDNKKGLSIPALDILLARKEKETATPYIHPHIH